jgi:hypothetical protein
VAGYDPEHERPDPEPDPFSPAPTGVAPAAFDVFQPEDVTGQSGMRAPGVSHWGYRSAPVPSSVPSEIALQVHTDRMLADHSRVEYRPDAYPNYKHATEGRSIEWIPGRGSFVAGESVPEGSSYLVMGTNGYDQTNQPNEVYGGDAANVGRYRLGYSIADHGLYEFWTKQGQDAELRAYAPLEPEFPADKPRIEGAAPYTPNSSGTATWTLSSWQIPSIFGLPSETALTDHEAADAGGYWGAGGGFQEGDGTWT